MEPSKPRLPYYHIYIEFTHGYIPMLNHLKRDKDTDVKHRLERALNLCKFDAKRQLTLADGAIIYPQIVRLYPKKRRAEIVVPVIGFVDPGFRPGVLLDALRTEFGEVVKGDVRVVRNVEDLIFDTTLKGIAK